MPKIAFVSDGEAWKSAHKSIEEADQFLACAPGSFAAPIVLALRDDLAASDVKLARVLGVLAHWSEEYEQFHVTAQACEAHKVAVDDLIARVTMVLEEESH
jgi:hypothetical protein